MRRDHQAVHDGLVGVTKFNPTYGLPMLDRAQVFKAGEIMPPVGVKTSDWIKSLER